MDKTKKEARLWVFTKGLMQIFKFVLAYFSKARYNRRMTYKTLSVKQPYAMYICAGVKTVENRTWKTTHRGKILIHASGDDFSYPDYKYLPKKYREELIDRCGRNYWDGVSQSMLNYCELLNMTYAFYGKDINQQEPPEEWLKAAVKEHGFFMPAKSIIGECDLVDIVQDSTDPFAEDGCYHWILDDAYVYKEPIINVVGHLRLWDYILDE
jgi:hypothetical protein